MRAFALLALVVACSSPPAAKTPAKLDDTAVRIRVAHAEARRGGGIAELVELATHGKKYERVLALRGLGRIGGATAIATLRTALGDSDRDVVAAAAAAIGLAASLDDEDLKITDALVAKADQPAVIEALGRAGDASAQPTLAKLVATMPEAGIALGRHGRRKIALSDEARAALIAALSSPQRYAATYALAREHIDKPDAPHLATTAAALAKLLDDGDPEVRAQAIVGIARHKQVAAHHEAIEAKLIDRDWRVAVEAVRALSADQDRAAVMTAVVRRVVGREHVANEALRALIGKRLGTQVELGAVIEKIDIWDPDRAKLWTWLFGASTLKTDDALRLAKSHPQRHLLLGLVAEWMKTKAPIAERRIALRELLADSDVRVRAAALGALPTMWSDGDQRDHEHTVDTVVAAIASKDPILSGSAIEAADELYDHEETHGALQAALVSRAEGERDVELATSLYGVIGKRAIGSGAAACRQGLDGHPVLAKAAAECLRNLGEPAPALSDPRAAKPPDLDVTQVIGRRVTWFVKTTMGELAIELLPDVAPWAVAMIVTLTKRGYYDGLEFHRVVPNFVVQGGDPTESGWGGPGFMIPAEPASVLDGRGFVAGGVGIADAGRDSGGSQWFVMHSRAAHLDGRYTWIGSVIEGKSADALRVGDMVLKATVIIE